MKQCATRIDFQDIFGPIMISYSSHLFALKTRHFFYLAGAFFIRHRLAQLEDLVSLGEVFSHWELHHDELKVPLKHQKTS